MGIWDEAMSGNDSQILNISDGTCEVCGEHGKIFCEAPKDKVVAFMGTWMCGKCVLDPNQALRSLGYDPTSRWEEV